MLGHSSETPWTAWAMAHSHPLYGVPPCSFGPCQWTFLRQCLFSRVRKSWNRGTFLTDIQPFLRTKADCKHWPISFPTVFVVALGLNKQSGSVRLVPAQQRLLIFWSLSLENCSCESFLSQSQVSSVQCCTGMHDKSIKFFRKKKRY